MNINDFDLETQEKIAEYQRNYFLRTGYICPLERAVHDITFNKNNNTDFNKVKDSDIES